MYKLGWFSTGRGQGSLNLLHSIVNSVHEGIVRAELEYVFCSREPGDAEGSDRYIKQVQDYGLKLITFSSKRFKPDLRKQGKNDPAALRRWRLEYDREIMKRLGSVQTDINVLAGYMLVVGEEMCRHYDMINLHPAAPDGPAGTWQEVIWQLIEQRAEKSGNMMHLVIEELDKGPPITYVTFPIQGNEFTPLWQEMDSALKKKCLDEIMKEEGEGNPLFSKIRHMGVERELPLVIQTVRAFAEARIRLENKQIVAGEKILEGPYCLTEDIEAQLQKTSR